MFSERAAAIPAELIRRVVESGPKLAGICCCESNPFRFVAASLPSSDYDSDWDYP